MFITSKLTVVFVLCITLLGVMAVLLTPREENPQILIPGAQVIVMLPGASAKEVEELVVTPLEGILSEMTGVDHTYAVARNSVGAVAIEFKVGQPKEASLVKLYDRIMSNRGRLPADAGVPQIRSVDVDDLPILALTLASTNYDDYGLKRIADRMAERLHSLEDVSVVTVNGGCDREIRIELDPERLQAFGLTFGQVHAAFDACNLSVPLRETVCDGSVAAINIKGFLTSVDDVRNQIIGLHEGRPIYVRDAADVRDGPPAERDRLTRLAFGAGDPRSQAFGSTEMPAVTIAVAKKRGANAVFVADRVLDRVERMKETLVPGDVQVVVTRNDGAKANDAVNTLLEHLALSILTVSLLLFLSLGWREAVVVVIAVPLVLFATLAFDLFGGITINRVTLYGLILSLGMLVDAGIVVIENIHRHYRHAREANRVDVTVAAVNEIGRATNLATLAVMLVFLSLLLLTGLPGMFFFPVTMDVPVAMAASLLVAYIVTPWAANRWVKEEHETCGMFSAKPRASEKSGLLRRIYLSLFRPLQENPRARRRLLLVLVAGMVCSGLQVTWQFIRPSGVGGRRPFLGVNLGFLPKDNKNTFNIVISMPETAPVEQTDRMVREIGGLLAHDRLVLNYQTWIGQAGIADQNALKQATAGNQGSSIAEIRVNLVNKHERRLSSIVFVRSLRTRIDDIRSRYPGAKVRLVEDPPGPPMRATILAEIYGPDPDGLRTVSRQVERAFADTYDLVDLSDSEAVDVLERQIVPDKEKAAFSHVSVAQIAQTLRLVYGGLEVGRVHLADEKRPVSVHALVPRRCEVDPARLDRIVVDNAQGRPVPLSELVKVVTGKVDRVIQHKDNERVTYVAGELGSTVPICGVFDLNHRLKGMPTPDGRTLRTGNLSLNPRFPDTVGGYQLLWGGEMRLTLDCYRDLAIALGVSLSLVFLLLVGSYRSFLIPLIAMSPVPLSLIGIFPGHWLLGVDFSASSMVGIVALSGVVIRSSLLIIDFIQDNQRRGMSLAEAAREAGAVRLRPILLTTMAIVLGSVIMIADPVFGGLAISLIFGSIVSTTLAAFVVPTLYCQYVHGTGEGTGTCQEQRTTSHDDSKADNGRYGPEKGVRSSILA